MIFAEEGVPPRMQTVGLVCWAGRATKARRKTTTTEYLYILQHFMVKDKTAGFQPGLPVKHLFLLKEHSY
jgi:hypothetical protein